MAVAQTLHDLAMDKGVPSAMDSSAALAWRVLERWRRGEISDATLIYMLDACESRKLLGK
jgi:hypothetical protein